MFESVQKPGPTILVIFGTVGDLSKRKLVPALYNLMLDNWLPNRFAMVGVSYHDQTDDSLRELLRDMIQNHLMQLLCMIAMEPPVTYKADEIRNRKIDVLNAVRPYTTAKKVRNNTVRGQYAAGRIKEKR